MASPFKGGSISKLNNVFSACLSLSAIFIGLNYMLNVQATLR
jgi:hypothetical protein